MYVARFDLRETSTDGRSRAARYRQALEMARYLDERECAAIVVSEHHFTSDGYLPSPLQLAGAIAAVTTRVQITVAVAVLPFYDPVRLAADLITLDYLSNGRVMTVFGLGYRPEEYELFGVDFGERGRVADQKLGALLNTLDQSNDEQASPRVTPAPLTRPHPLIAWGGKSKAAARRAGRFGLGFYAQTNTDGLRDAYKEAAISSGHKPGFCFLPPPQSPYAVFVNDDTEAGWGDVGDAMLHDAASYQDWNDSTSDIASFSSSTSVDDLRAENGAHRVVTSDEARELLSEHGFVSLHPMCGGLDPEVAWQYLKRAVEVLEGSPAD